MSDNYTPARAWSAEGARVGIVSCKRCGVALVLDPDERVNVLELHDEWHARLNGGNE